jgi:hypothetical protein
LKTFITLRLRRLAVIPTLAAALGLGLWMPIPATGDAHLDRVVTEVHERLPGWRVVRAEPSWEGSYAVVAACGPRELGFQVVPEHGLAVGDAWIQPNDEWSADRLEHVSDHDSYIVWYQNPVRERTLSCRSELARDQSVEVVAHRD